MCSLIYKWTTGEKAFLCVVFSLFEYVDPYPCFPSSQLSLIARQFILLTVEVVGLAIIFLLV